MFCPHLFCPNIGFDIVLSRVFWYVCQTVGVPVCVCVYNITKNTSAWIFTKFGRTLPLDAYSLDSIAFRLILKEKMAVIAIFSMLFCPLTFYWRVPYSQAGLPFSIDAPLLQISPRRKITKSNLSQQRNFLTYLLLDRKQKWGRMEHNFGPLPMINQSS